MQRVFTTLKGFLADDRAMETLEYAVIVGLVVAGTLIALTAIGVWVAGIYTTTQTAIGA